MLIRNFRPGDEPALHAVFHSAVHLVACADYSAEQIAAWAPADMDRARWAARMQGIRPFVVERGGEVVAYADVQPGGYIDHFFVSGHHPRQGIGGLLMRHLHLIATARRMTTLTSDVSRTAQPFFAHFGFHIGEQRTPALRGVVIPNALMRKDLSAMAA